MMDGDARRRNAEVADCHDVAGGADGGRSGASAGRILGEMGRAGGRGAGFAAKVGVAARDLLGGDFGEAADRFRASDHAERDDDVELRRRKRLQPDSVAQGGNRSEPASLSATQHARGGGRLWGFRDQREVQDCGGERGARELRGERGAGRDVSDGEFQERQRARAGDADDLCGENAGEFHGASEPGSESARGGHGNAGKGGHVEHREPVQDQYSVARVEAVAGD